MTPAGITVSAQGVANGDRWIGHRDWCSSGGDTLMTTIKASCPSCGDVELTPQQVRLVVCSVKAWSYYAFTCTSCLEEVRKPAGRDVVALLISGGVIAEPWSVPAEVLEERAGPTLSYDD